jgi:hypothetical protein
MSFKGTEYFFPFITYQSPFNRVMFRFKFSYLLPKGNLSLYSSSSPPPPSPSLSSSSSSSFPSFFFFLLLLPLILLILLFLLLLLFSTKSSPLPQKKKEILVKSPFRILPPLFHPFHSI